MTMDSVAKRVIDRYIEAVKAMDPAKMLENYADDVVVFDTFSNWQHRGKDAWGEIVTSWLTGEGMQQSCTVENVTIHEDGDLAVAHADVHYSAEHEGKPHGMWNRATWVLRCIDGTWGIVHEHTSIPIDDATMKAIADRSQ